MAYETILVDKKDAIVTITLNRPERMNAMSVQMREELTQAWQEADEDWSVRCVILKGAGRCFCSGYDISGIADRPMPDYWYGRLPNFENFSFKHNGGFRFHWTLLKMNKPTIAVVHGYCMGGGLDMAFCCDMIVASEDAQFGMIEMGHISGPPTFIEPWRMPYQAVAEMVFTGDSMTAQRCYELGAVNRVVPKEKLEQETLKLAERVARIDVWSLSCNKEALRVTQEIMGRESALEYCHKLVASTHASILGSSLGPLLRNEGMSLQDFLQWRKLPHDERWAKLKPAALTLLKEYVAAMEKELEKDK